MLPDVQCSLTNDVRQVEEAMMAIETARAPAVGHRRRWPVLAVVLIAEAMDILDTTTVNVAGPAVRRSLGGGIGLVQWLAGPHHPALPAPRLTRGRPRRRA